MLHNIFVWLISRAIFWAIVAAIIVVKVIVAILCFVAWLL